MKFLVNENFQFNGLRRSGVTLTGLSKGQILEEIKKGFHKNRLYGNRRWVSGLLNHCVPANDKTMSFLIKNLPEGVTPEEVGLEPEDDIEEEEDDSKEIHALWERFEEIGKSYDKRWGLPRLRSELLKAQKETGKTKKTGISEE